MSLTVSAGREARFEPVEEGTHLGVCRMVVDLGVQRSDLFQSQSRKVLIGWELPGLLVETEDGPRPRSISRQYTASLGENANLRQELAAWRGRDFSPEELENFDLRKIVGTSCLVNVEHRTANGKTCAVVRNVLPLPKGMAGGVLRERPVVYDMDRDPPGAVEALPRWVAELVKRSADWPPQAAAAPAFTELPDDGGPLPF